MGSAPGVDDRVTLQREAREFANSKHLRIQIDTLVGQLMLRVRHRMEVQNGEEEARKDDGVLDTLLGGVDVVTYFERGNYSWGSPQCAYNFTTGKGNPLLHQTDPHGGIQRNNSFCPPGIWQPRA